MKSQKRKYGLIGAGAIAQTWAQAFALSMTSKLVAVSDLDKNRADTFAKTFKCLSFSRYEDMLDSCQIDAVIICTPPVTHPEIAITCLGQNIHVLCEKPFSINSSRAQAMFQKAKRHNVLITMASKFRYVDDLIRAKRIVRSGILGDIVSFKNSFISDVDMSQRWNSSPHLSGGGVLIDNGTHSVDIVRYFLGPIEEIFVCESKGSRGLEVEESVHVQVKTENGCEGTIDVVWNGNQAPHSYIEIQGTQGLILIGWQESKYQQFSSSEWVVFGSGYNKLAAFTQQLDNFSNTILGDELLIITYEDALASVKVIEAGYQSLKENKWIPICQKDRYGEHQKSFYERMEGQRL
ncbi:MAG: Gfo/Idh/MocA family oxidoreductase [Candidatus Aminicenantes bacterium]|nr:Gfo/Idh/MocA family oxidoreductase [Candidatus Aminicenantes bacterium]